MHDNLKERRQYPAEWAVLNRELNAIEQFDGNLLNVVERLREYHLATGFIRDDLSAVQCYSFPDPDNPQHYFSVQYNPARVRRLKVRVDARPPPRGESVNDDCLLCNNNIEWQHNGIEMGYEIDINRSPFNIWMNAYPLMPVHIVVATQEHIPQAWDLGNAGVRCFAIDEIVANLAAIAQRLPGYIGLYNGDGAGTSVPAHFHYQLFKRRNAEDLFPLELAPFRQVADLFSVIEDYPVEAVRWSGDDTNEVISRATTWINEWLVTSIEARPTLSANIFAMTDISGELLQIYFVPRDKAQGHSPHMAGMIGSLEILGELVLTTENEKLDLDRGKLDYRSLARILADVRVPL